MITAGRTHLLVALLLSAYLALSLAGAWNRGATFDETAHIAAGYNVWLRGDFRFDPANGDFLKRWATLPLRVLSPAFPAKEDPAWRRADFFVVGRDFLFRLGNDPALILRSCRAMVALLGVLLGLLVFACSRHLFGNAAGIVSLLLFVVCPHMEAYGATVSTEIPAALALMASAWFLWRLLHRLTPGILVLSVLATSLLAISKLTAVLLLPVALVLVVLRLACGRPWLVGGDARQGPERRLPMALLIVGLAALHVAAAWGTVWAAYDFRYEARVDPGAVDEPLASAAVPAGRPAPRSGALPAFLAAHRLLPEGYLSGLTEMSGNLGLRPSFLDGTWRAGGSVAFFPYALWAKTSPFLWVILLLAALAWRRPFGYEAAPLLVLWVVYAAAALSQHVNIGHRHILPLYPLLYTLAGASVLLRGRIARVILPLALIGVSLDGLSVWPHSFAYFSPLVGGPSQGYRRLADSSLDWGQDLPELASWLRRHPDQPAYVSYFGTADPDYYHLQARRLEGFPDWREMETYAFEPGLYAISATMFQGLYTQPFGPWTEADERDYQRLASALGLSRQTARTSRELDAALTAHPDDSWQAAYGRYEKLRLNRLCGWLRATGRAPDAQVGHSILIWSLDQEALDAALWGAPRELKPTPEGVTPSA